MPETTSEEPEAAWRSVVQIFKAYRSRVDADAQNILLRYEIRLSEVRESQREETKTKGDPTSDG